MRRLCLLMAGTALLAALGSPRTALAGDSPWYWHYTPVDSFTNGIGVSRPEGTRAAPWQVRVNLGYELHTLGATLQLQQTLLDEHPQWYLASGLRILRYRGDTNVGPCAVAGCEGSDSRQWEGVVFSRWTWGLTAENMRLDLGYGAQFRVREDAGDGGPSWSLDPTLDVTLGWRL